MSYHIVLRGGGRAWTDMDDVATQTRFAFVFDCKMTARVPSTRSPSYQRYLLLQGYAYHVPFYPRLPPSTSADSCLLL